MDLREYLFRNNLHLSDFAKIVNYSRQHVSGVMHGTIKPGKKLAEAIEKATNGEVKAEELLKGK
jgi:transcriptional regulator with XRE-family HTH domain